MLRIMENQNMFQHDKTNSQWYVQSHRCIFFPRESKNQVNIKQSLSQDKTPVWGCKPQWLQSSRSLECYKQEPDTYKDTTHMGHTQDTQAGIIRSIASRLENDKKEILCYDWTDSCCIKRSWIVHTYKHLHDILIEKHNWHNEILFV